MKKYKLKTLKLLEEIEKLLETYRKQRNLILYDIDSLVQIRTFHDFVSSDSLTYADLRNKLLSVDYNAEMLEGYLDIRRKTIILRLSNLNGDNVIDSFTFEKEIYSNINKDIDVCIEMNKPKIV